MTPSEQYIALQNTYQELLHKRQAEKTTIDNVYYQLSTMKDELTEKTVVIADLHRQVEEQLVKIASLHRTIETLHANEEQMKRDFETRHFRVHRVIIQHLM
jgi:uncharacterized protein YaaN involved in tellurite resistance